MGTCLDTSCLAVEQCEVFDWFVALQHRESLAMHTGKSVRVFARFLHYSLRLTSHTHYEVQWCMCASCIRALGPQDMEYTTVTRD